MVRKTLKSKFYLTGSTKLPYFGAVAARLLVFGMPGSRTRLEQKLPPSQ